jgi:hypothetical protein
VLRLLLTATLIGTPTSAWASVPVTCTPVNATAPDSSPFTRQMHALLAAEAGPAYQLALGAEGAAAVSPKSPWVAAGLSALPALALFGLITAGTALDTQVQAKANAACTKAGTAPDNCPVVGYGGYLLFMNGAIPLTFGGGQFYAGDPWRAFWVTLGGPAVTLAGAITGTLLSGLRPPLYGSGGGTKLEQSDAITGGIVACTLYGIWSAWDAYQVAKLTNVAAVPARVQGGPIAQAPTSFFRPTKAEKEW